MFFGEFAYRLDEKGRVLIPPEFRSVLKGELILMPGAEKCIALYPITQWEKIATSLTSASLSRSKIRRLNRALFASAFTRELDGQGRVALPQPLREYAGITEEVVIAGVNASLEIWDKKRWLAEKTMSQEQVWQIIESLEGSRGD